MLTKPYEMFFSVDHGEVLHQCCGSGSVFRSVVDPHMYYNKIEAKDVRFKSLRHKFTIQRLN